MAEASRPRGRARAVVCAAGLVAGLAPLAGPAEAQAPPGYVVPPLVWVDCTPPGDPLPQECATALVPLDHDRPDGALEDVALLRVPANGLPAERVGTLFVNPGGPGGSGTDLAPYEASMLSPAMRRAFDVVGFDPRTVGASEPAPLCPLPPDVPIVESTDPAVWAGYIRTRSAVELPGRTSCVVANAATASTIGTVAVARDLDLLRQAVGDELLTYHGISYGTRLGSVYAQLFGDRVRAMVLDGNMDPFGDNYSFFLRGPAFDDAFSVFRAWRPGVAAQFDAVLAVLAGGPFTLPDGNVVTSLDVRNTVGSQLGSEALWPQMATTIDQLHQAIVVGSSTATLPALRDTPPDPAFAPVGVLAPVEVEERERPTFWGVMCQDNPARPTVDEYAAAAAGQVAAAPLFGYQSASEIATCLQSPLPVRPIPRNPALATPPLLLVQSRHDPQTPFPWALSLRSTTPPGSRLVIYEGATHGMYALGGSACVDAIGDAYLLTGALPTVDVSCGSVLPP